LRRFEAGEAETRYQARLRQMRAFLSAALERASRLNLALDREGKRPDPVRYFAFGGDYTPTPARAMIIDEPDGSFTPVMRAKNLPRKYDTPEIEHLMSEPGDGSVTRASLLSLDGAAAGEGQTPGIRIDYSLFLCETHRKLTENITFQDNLLQFLLYR